MPFVRHRSSRPRLVSSRAMVLAETTLRAQQQQLRLQSSCECGRLISESLGAAPPDPRFSLAYLVALAYFQRSSIELKHNKSVPSPFLSNETCKTRCSKPPPPQLRGLRPFTRPVGSAVGRSRGRAVLLGPGVLRPGAASIWSSVGAPLLRRPRRQRSRLPRCFW